MNMEKKFNTMIIAKDGWPLEEFIGRPITNFIRRLLHADYKVCRDCWQSKQAMKSPSNTASQEGE